MQILKITIAKKKKKNNPTSKFFSKKQWVNANKNNIPTLNDNDTL